MVKSFESSKNTADAIIVGGGSVGLHTASAMRNALGKNARILVITQESEWGGIAERSLEQFRMFNDSYGMAEIVSKGIELYEHVDQELRAQKLTDRAYEKFPYVFTVGAVERPEDIASLLPANTPQRPDLAYYQKLKEDTETWGFDPRAQEITPEDLRQLYPLLDGDGIKSAMLVENSGRLHFDVMRSWLMESSRTDGDGHGVTYRTRTQAHQILLNRNGEAIGVDLGSEKIYSDKIILALGAFVVNLASLLPGDESVRLAQNFNVIQRELFFANMPGIQSDTNLFLISPDLAMGRISTREGHASYGYAAEDDATITSPNTDPRPNDAFVDKYGINHKELFVGRTYAMLSECSTRWNSDHHDSTRPNLAIEPFGYSAGSYTTYVDGMPVVGKIGDTGVILAAGSSHSGVMGGQGIAELVVDCALDQNNLSKLTHDQTDINRLPSVHTGLKL